MSAGSKSKTLRLSSKRRPSNSYNIFYKLERMHLLQTAGAPDDKVQASFTVPDHFDPFEHPRPKKYTNLKMPPYWYSSFRVEEKRKHTKKEGRIDMKELSKIISKQWRNADTSTKAYCKKLAKIDAYISKAESTTKKRTGNASSYTVGKNETLSSDNVFNNFDERDRLQYTSSKYNVGSLRNDNACNEFEWSDKTSCDSIEFRPCRYLPIQNDNLTKRVSSSRDFANDKVALDDLYHNFYSGNESCVPIDIDPVVSVEKFILPTIKHEDITQLMGVLSDFDHNARSERYQSSSFYASKVAYSETMTTSYQIPCDPLESESTRLRKRNQSSSSYASEVTSSETTTTPFQMWCHQCTEASEDIS